MPATEQQKAAAQRWRDKNRERFNEMTMQWKSENADKQRAYARKCNLRRAAFKRACNELFNCLID
jgi:hypothetical protein